MNYTDPQEQEFAFEIGLLTLKITEETTTDAQGHVVPLFSGRIDVSAIDDFLQSGNWDESSRAELLEERASAFASYRQGDFEGARQKMIALHWRCDYVGFRKWAARVQTRQKAEIARKELMVKANLPKK